MKSWTLSHLKRSGQFILGRGVAGTCSGGRLPGAVVGPVSVDEADEDMPPVGNALALTYRPTHSFLYLHFFFSNGFAWSCL